MKYKCIMYKKKEKKKLICTWKILYYLVMIKWCDKLIET